MSDVRSTEMKLIILTQFLMDHSGVLSLSLTRKKYQLLWRMCKLKTATQAQQFSNPTKIYELFAATVFIPDAISVCFSAIQHKEV